MINRRTALSIDYFNDGQIREDLKGKAIQGGSVSVVSRILSTLIQIGGVVILARLLSPDDWGLVTMATVITNFFFVFQELGLADATIQASGIKHEQVSTLFWINLAFGVLITVILVALSPAVAWFYKNSQVTLIMVVSSIGFIFTGLYTQHIAILKRNMLFVKVSIIELVSNFLSVVASIILALIGWRYWAIVLRPVFVGLIMTLLAWLFCHWRPGPPRRNSGVRPLLKFGANSVGFYIVNYFSLNVDKSLIGKNCGAEQLGYYSRAFYLSTTPSSQFTQSLFHVAVSTLSKLRDEPQDYRRYYLRAISVVLFIGMPLSVFMVVMSKDLVYLLLGSQWNQAAQIFSILGLSAGMNVLYTTNGWIHVSLGRTDRWLKWGIIGSLTMVAGFFIGLPFGPRGVAWAYTLITIFLTFPGILYAGNPIGLRLGEVISSIWKYTCASILSGGLLYYVKKTSLFNSGIIFRISLGLLMYILIYLLAVVLLYRDIKPIKDFVLMFMTMLRKIIPSPK